MEGKRIQFWVTLVDIANLREGVNYETSATILGNKGDIHCILPGILGNYSRGPRLQGLDDRIRGKGVGEGEGVVQAL